MYMKQSYPRACQLHLSIRHVSLRQSCVHLTRCARLVGIGESLILPLR